MKLTLFLLTAAIVQVSATGLSQTVSFNGKNAHLQEVFSAIEKQTGFKVAYNKMLLDKANTISMNVTDVPLNNFLQQIFQNQPLEYSIENTTIVISSKPVKVNLEPTANVLAPPITISGRVVNENGNALAGASINIKATNMGAIADSKGYYKIENIAEGTYTLEVTNIGYKSVTKVIKLGGDANVSIDFELEINPYGFNDIIVSANLVASKKREIASAVTTITAKQIEQLPISNIAELFRGEVPGGNTWNYGPGSTTNAIKLRGDIDFYGSASTVKIFIDGIELVDASYVSTLPLSAIDHVEVLHGPQASTLYGSGATSGVIYIFTKKGKIGGPHIDAKISAGTIASKYVDKTAYQQDHSLNISGGSEGISYNFGGSYFHYDPYWEDGNNTNTSGFGGVKARQGKFTAELTGQYNVREYGIPLNPILKELVPAPAFTIPNYRSMKQSEQTFGLNIIYTPFVWWQHNLSLGVNQNNISSVQTTPRYTYVNDTLNGKDNSNLSKKSYRYYTTLRIPTGSFLKSTITAGFDHYLYESSFLSIQGTGTDPNFSPVGTAYGSLQKYSNTGYYVQGVFGFDNKLFVTAGIRSESTKQFGNSSGSSTAPRIGASFVLDLGKIMVKPRVGYGKSIKVPDPAQFVEQTRTSFGFTVHQFANPDLKPQEQTGYDIGFDAEFGNGLGTLEATYYNQLVNNYIIGVYDYSNLPLIEGRYVNVGKIKNSGLELAGTLNTNSIKFRVTYSITNSKVVDMTNTGYAGLYENGDKILRIPKSSGGATFTYTFPSLFKASSSNGGNISLGATYVGEWVNMNEAAQNKDYYINFDYSKTNRDYVITYPAYVLFRLGINYSITKNIEAFLNVNNLFNSYQFESSNVVPSQGRVTMLGIRLNY